MKEYTPLTDEQADAALAPFDLLPWQRDVARAALKGQRLYFHQPRRAPWLREVEEALRAIAALPQGGEHEQAR